MAGWTTVWAITRLPRHSETWIQAVLLLQSAVLGRAASWRISWFNDCDPSVLRETIKMQVVQLFCNIPDASEYDQMVVKDITRMATSFKWDIALCLDFHPSLFRNIEDPKVIELFRVVILPSKHIQVTIVHRSGMTTSWAWSGLARGNFDILPLISSKVVERNLVSSVTLLEASEYDHLGSI